MKNNFLAINTVIIFLVSALVVQANDQDLIKKADELSLFKKADEAVELLEDRLEELEDEPIKKRAALYFSLAKAYKAQGEYKDAFELLENLAVEKAYDLNAITALQYEIAEDVYRRDSESDSIFSDYRIAIKFYEAFLKNAPYASQAAQTQLRIGQVLENNDKEEEALIAYRKVIRNYPRSNQSGAARVYIAQYLERNMRGSQGDINMLYEARAQLQVFMLKYKNKTSEMKPIVEKMLARFDEREAQRWYETAQFYLRKVHYSPDAAKRYLEKTVKRFPKTDAGIRAEQLLIDLAKEEQEEAK